MTSALAGETDEFLYVGLRLEVGEEFVEDVLDVGPWSDELFGHGYDVLLDDTGKSACVDESHGLIELTDGLGVGAYVAADGVYGGVGSR